MKQKLLNIRASDELNQFLEGIYRLSKYRAKGISSKSDLLRYALFKTLENENKGILAEFKEIPEIKEFLNPVPSNSQNEMKNKIQDYFKNR